MPKLSAIYNLEAFLSFLYYGRGIGLGVLEAQRNGENEAFEI